MLQIVFARVADFHLSAHDCVEGRCTQGDDDARFRVVDFFLEPRTAGVDVTLRRRLVDAARPARLPEEVLDGVGDVDVLRVDPGFRDCATQKLSGRTYEGCSL